MNNDIFYFFYSFSHQSNLLDGVIIFFAVYFPWVVIFSAGVFLLRHHEVFKAGYLYQILMQKKKEIFSAFIVGVIAYASSYIIKFFFQTSRPFNLLDQVRALFPESGYAFPSGHASFFMALAVSIFFFHKKVGYIFMIFALIIGLARIASGVHFPIDILGGFILGTLVAVTLNLASYSFPRKDQNKKHG